MTHIEAAQEAGNEAYAEAEENALNSGMNPVAANVMCADAYRAAYKAKLAEIAGACEREAERKAHPTSEEMIAIVQEALTQPAIEY